MRLAGLLALPIAFSDLRYLRFAVPLSRKNRPANPHEYRILKISRAFKL